MLTTTSLKSFVKKLNPQNTLFGRIFIWFWLAVTLMIIGAFTVARFVGQTWELSAPTNIQLERVQALQANLQKQINRNIDLERALSRSGQRGRWELMVYDVNRAKMVLGFRREFLPDKNRFIDISDAQSPVVIRTNSMEFIGPLLINGKKGDLKLFAGRLLPRGERPIFFLSTAFIVFLVLGTFAVMAISFSIVKPIKRLGELSNNFARGNAVEPEGTLTKRKDELGQLHDDIYAMASKLAQSLVQQKALMANISHELRTPLTRMQLAVAMLEPKGLQSITYAQRIEKEIGVMDDLIGQALQLAKIDGQQHLASTIHSQLNQAIMPVLDDLAFEAKGLGKMLTWNEFDNIDLALNITSFTSAIENVARNAIKYSGACVKVEINSANGLSLQDNERYLYIVVEDDGEGLTNEHREQIFEPFYRAPAINEQTSNQSQALEPKGTGLGLAIAKAAVELHKGHINVYESDLGGLKIVMSFPIEPL